MKVKPNFQNKFALSCDWLQIHVKHREDFLSLESPYFSFKRTGQSKVFKNIYEIKDLLYNKTVASYCTDANECIMPSSEGILKFENSQLYIHENLKTFVKKFLKKLNFKFIGITRLDIAFDFEEFYMGYTPENFIKDYTGSKIHKVRGNEFGLYGKQRNQEICYESISFGSKTSNITAKMYNKTREMKNNYKPWIALTKVFSDTLVIKDFTNGT